MKEDGKNGLNSDNIHELNIPKTTNDLGLTSVHESVAIENIGYNPRLVSCIEDDESGRVLPVITCKDFSDFAIENKLANKTTCERLFTVLSRKYFRNEQFHQDRFIYMIEDTKTRKAVMRADKLSEMNRRCEDGNLRVYQLTERLEKLLSDVERSLFIAIPAREKQVLNYPEIK